MLMLRNKIPPNLNAAKAILAKLLGVAWSLGTREVQGGCCLESVSCSAEVVQEVGAFVSEALTLI